jgi:MFS family permease
MVYPLLPLFLVMKLGVTPAIVGMIEGIAESVASLLKVFSGALSDKLGRRKSIAIGGYSCSAFGKVFLIFATAWPSVLVSRVIDRLGKGIRTAPRDALIAESTDAGRQGAAFGLHRFMDAFGASIGILLSYHFITRYNGDFKIVFAYSIIPAVLGVVFLFFAREKAKSPAQSKKGHLVNFSWRSLNPRLRAFLIVTVIFTLGNSSNEFLLLRAGNLGFSAGGVILCYLTYKVLQSITSYPAGRISDVIGRRGMLVGGYLTYGLVYLGFAVAKTPSFLWLLFAAYGVYNGVTEGVEKALVSDIAPVDQKATLIGLHATLVGIGLLPASALAGLLWSVFGAAAPFYFGGVMGIAASAGLFLVLRGESSEKSMAVQP